MRKICFNSGLCTLLILITLIQPLILKAYSPEYIIKKPEKIVLYSTKSFKLSLKFLIICNRTSLAGSLLFGQPIYANNFWSKVKLESVKVLRGSVKEFRVETYDLNVMEGGFYKKIPKDIRYGFTHDVLLLNIENTRYREEIVVEVNLDVNASRVDSSKLSFVDISGNIRDAKRELGDDYDIYTAHTFYWDYLSPPVQRILKHLKEFLVHKYQKPIEDIPIYLITREILNWLAYNMYYMDRFDYPTFRLKASQILNRTIEIEGKSKYYGVCRHIVDVFITLARGLGVPSNRYEGMLFDDFEGKLTFLGFHAWAEVYVPRVGWLPIEVTITHPYERDLVNIGDLEYAYYVPLVHEYNNYELPFVSPFVVTILSAQVYNASSNGVNKELSKEENDIFSLIVYIPTLGYISLKDLTLIVLISLLFIDNLYIHRKLSRKST